MKTVRQSTFETNSSSCHCLQIMYAQDWNNFKNGELFIKKDEFELGEHELKFFDMRPKIDEDFVENWRKWFISKDELVEKIYSFIKNEVEQNIRLFKENHDKLLWEIIVKKNEKDLRDFILLFLEKKSQEDGLYVLEKFDKIVYKIGKNEYSEDKITVNDFETMLDDYSYYNEIKEDCELPYFYHNVDDGWDSATVEEFIDAKNKQQEKNIVFVDRTESC